MCVGVNDGSLIRFDSRSIESGSQPQNAEWQVFMRLILATVFACCIAGQAGSNTEHARQNQPTLSLPAKIVDVHDGDTLTAEVTIRAKIRLRDCWAKELKQLGGVEAKSFLVTLANGKPCVVSVPLGKANDVGDVMTFGRVLANVSVDGKDLATEMINAGHATLKP